MPLGRPLASWDYSQALVSLLRLSLGRATNPVPQSVTEQSPGLFESEKLFAAEFGEKLALLFTLKRELDHLEHQARKKRHLIASVEEECIAATRGLKNVQITILEKVMEHRKRTGGPRPGPDRTDDIGAASTVESVLPGPPGI